MGDRNDLNAWHSGVGCAYPQLTAVVEKNIIILL